MRIIIVGGSIAGLFTGIFLSDLPLVESITILEKSQEGQQKDQGAGIHLSNEVVNTVAKYAGVQPEEYCVQMNSVKQLDEKGNVVMSGEVIMWACSWGSLFRVLRRKFSEQGQEKKSRYRNGCTVVNVLDEGDTIQTHIINETGQPETVEVELVIAADGISSTIRKLVLPECKRVYAGYAVLRGIVPPLELPVDVQAFHKDSSTIGFTRDSQIISYWVPGDDATVNDKQTDRCLNWAWYRTYSHDELEDIMIDSSGSRRAFTVPQGALREQVAEGIRTMAQKELSRMHAEVVENTKQPFLQAVTDSMASNNVFFDGKLILIGDAFAGQRPHTAAACAQCTFHTMLLKSYLQGDISIDHMSRQAQEFSKILVDAGEEMGSYTQSTTLAPALKARKYLVAWRTAQVELTRRYLNQTRQDLGRGE